MKKSVIISVLLVIASIAFTVLLTKYDVKPIGPNGSEVGFATINEKLSMDYNETVYKVSKYLGYLALLIPAVYACIGLFQIIKEKSFFKVDNRLYVLAIFYVLVLATYMLFEKVIINYRPVLMHGELEASYPSSHTLMSIFICISAIMINREMFKANTRLINLGLFLLSAAIVVTRFVSGVHWFTDITGAVLISITLLTMFKALIKE